jgi:hypothetical protein
MRMKGVFEVNSRLANHPPSEPLETSFDVDDLTGLRSWNHVLEVCVLIDRARRIIALFSFALDATLLFVLLFLFTRLLAAAFFQLVFLWFGLFRPGRRYRSRLCRLQQRPQGDARRGGARIDARDADVPGIPL